ncbi:recombinase family protein [Streptomyces polychromogenes]|uniref:Recombinase family protein n=1 Tax=Streptomyces polychromogenes TaxID=67342 RepID=A0ABP3F2F4_9ACTN
MPTSYADQTRYLIAARRSVDKQDGTSIPRQVEAGQREVIARKGALAGIVRDEGVSGALDFPDRPKLAQWLTTEGLSRWDCMIVTTQDRLSRDDLHFNAFMRHMLDWNKQLIILDDPTIDLRDPDCRMILTIKATQAAKELHKIRERVRDTSEWLRSKGFQTKGNPPVGYVLAKQRGHYVLMPELRYARHAVRMAKWVREEGKSRRWVAAQMNKKGVLSWTDYQRTLKARKQERDGEEVTATPPRGVKWTDQTVDRILRNPAMAGYMTYRGELVMDELGEPRMATEYPHLTHEQWRQTVAVLDATSRKGVAVSDPDSKPDEGTYSGASLCEGCGGAMYLHRKKRATVLPPSMTKLGSATHYEDYRCRNAKHGFHCVERANCKKYYLEEFAEDAMMTAVGDLPEVIRMWEEGESHTEKLERARERLVKLSEDYAEGEYDGPQKEKFYWTVLEGLTKKIARLESLPQRPARAWYQRTGRTWRQKWARMDNDERREFLDKSGIRIVIWRRGEDGETPGILVHLGDLKKLALAAGALPDDVADTVAADHLDNVSRSQYLSVIKRGLLKPKRSKDGEEDELVA